jgi:hypothetical protein
MAEHQRRFRDGRGGTSTFRALLVGWAITKAQQLILLFTVTCSFSFFNIYYMQYKYVVANFE